MKVKKKKILIIALFAAAVLLLVSYFLFIAPLLKEPEAGIVELDLMEGETRISDKLSNFYITPSIARSEIQEIKVTNADGSYRIFRNASDTFELDGYPGLTFDDMGFAGLIANPVAQSRVARDITEEELVQYGLDNPVASRTITTTDGRVFTVNIGDAMLTGGGYYASVEGRNAVYIIGLTSASYIIQPLEALVKPLLLSGMTTSDYYLVDNFIIYRGDKPFAAVDRLSADTAQTIDLALIYRDALLLQFILDLFGRNGTGDFAFFGLDLERQRLVLQYLLQFFRFCSSLFIQFSFLLFLSVQDFL